MKSKLPLRVGITGGIGSGKTTISRIFEHLSVPIYYSDDAAKWLMNNDPQLIQQLKDHFGEHIYNEKNELKKAEVATMVFSDAAILKKWESFVHPAVFMHGAKWYQEQIGEPYTLNEAALTFESGSYKLLDKVITVYAPKSLRIQRVMARDQAQKTAIRARMAKQMSDDQKMVLADYIIYNDGKNLLIPQVLAIHKNLLKHSRMDIPA